MRTKQNPDQDHAAAASVLASDKAVEFVLGQAETPEKFCSALSKLFGVHLTEVALMRLEHGLLKFVLPEELKTAGAIPVSSSSAISAQTATTRKAAIFNRFAQTIHERAFETVKLSQDDSSRPEVASIQKLMSAPVLDSQKKVLGVIQICRKGYSLTSAGPDFALDDLRQLELAAKVASGKPFMKEGKSSRFV